MTTIDLSERVYCADVIYPVGVVGLAGRQIAVYSLENGPTAVGQIESPLSHQVPDSIFFSCFKNINSACQLPTEQMHYHFHGQAKAISSRFCAGEY